ncbi:hypothetical protein PilKf_00349 [Pillotina sp. SPG140]|jgi:hypothetical protein
MKKSLYLGFVTLVVAMSLVFIGCSDKDEDETAPKVTEATVSSQTNTATGTTATVTFKSDEAGKYYYVVLASNVDAPNAAAIKGATSGIKGTGDATASATNSFNVIGLAAGTKYKAYIVVEDAAGNISEVFATAEFTPTKDVTAPTVTSTPTGTPGTNKITLKFTSTELGKYYYVVYADVTQTPIDPTVVKTGSDASNVKIKGNGNITATTETTVEIGPDSTKLPAGTYKVHLVVEDAAGNLSTTVYSTLTVTIQ